MFNYRPRKENHTDYDPAVDGYWDNNPASNALAYLSDRFLPTWCKAPGHWTIVVMDYFWTDCGCCLFMRGLTLGYFIGAFTGALVTAAAALLIF